MIQVLGLDLRAQEQQLTELRNIWFRVLGFTLGFGGNRRMGGPGSAKRTHDKEPWALSGMLLSSWWPTCLGP